MSKAKFKVGDRVRLIKDTDGYSKGERFVVAEDNSDTPWVTGVDGCRTCFEDKDLELSPKTLDNLEVGDELINSGGDIIYVLGVCGRIIFTSSLNMPNKTESYWTKEELEDYWTVKSAKSEIEELTLAQVCEELGREVKIKK